MKRKYIRTCKACGWIDHVAGDDGLCSRSSLAYRDFERGDLGRIAAKRHGIGLSAVSERGRRLQADLPMKERRRLYIQHAAIRRAVTAGHMEFIASRIGELRMLPWPPDVSQVPEIGGELLAHDEIPDPPTLREVGWRTQR